jgi:hypothetical protein
MTSDSEEYQPTMPSCSAWPTSPSDSILCYQFSEYGLRILLFCLFYSAEGSVVMFFSGEGLLYARKAACY